MKTENSDNTLNNITNTLKLFFKYNKVLEIRIPKARINGRYETTLAGYFDAEHLDEAAKTVLKYNKKVPGIYLSLNRVNPSLISRYNNRLETKPKTTTSDKDILLRQFLLIDIDPIRPTDISSTFEEHDAAIAKAYLIKEIMAKHGWPDPIIADSGNGAGLLYRIELPNTGDSKELVKKCLEAFGLLFGDEKIDIDTSVFNAARIVKLYGTSAKKGDDTPERPHRESKLLETPADIQPVSIELLNSITSIIPPEEKHQPDNNSYSSGAGFDIEAWMKQYDIDVASAKSWGGGTKYVLNQCPFDSGHTYPDAAIIKMSSGALVFHCFHDSCSGHDWQALRKMKEPQRTQPPVQNSKQNQNQKNTNNNTTPQPPVPVIEYNKTDLGNAKRLVALIDGDARYCYPYKGWLIWNGKRWAEDKTGKIDRQAKVTIQSMYAEALNLDQDNKKALITYALRCESAQAIKNMIELAQSELGVPVMPEEFDKNKWIFNIQNGTIDLKTGKIRPHDRNDMITKISPVTYNPDAKCPVWIEFLETIFQGNQDIIKYVQKQCGYVLSGSTREEDFSIHYGVGGNGKSKLNDQISYILGDYFIKVNVETVLDSGKTQAGNAASGDVARMAGARLVVASEPDRGARLKEGMIKDLTGREQITARRLYEKEFQFYPEFKFWLVTNHKPNLKSQDGGIWRRIKLVPFEVVIPDEKIDVNLDLKLRNESSGILNWMIEGCLLWQTEGMNVPEKIKEATQDYKEDMDILGDFFRQCCEKEKSLMTPNKWLYLTYKAWCNIYDIKPLSHVVFPRAMEERGFRKARKTEKGVIWKNVGLNRQLLETIINFESRAGASETDGLMVMTAFLKTFFTRDTIEKVSKKTSEPFEPSGKEPEDSDFTGKQTVMKMTVNRHENGDVKTIKKAGENWMNIKAKSINSITITEFCMWYCQEVDTTKQPLQIKPVAAQVFKVTPEPEPGQQETQKKQPENGNKNQSQAEKMLHITEMIRNCYGTAPVSAEGIKLLADQVSADLGIPKEEALEYVRQRMRDRDRGR
ncbi:MAG: hypothetical protein IBX72_14850 [Nitrospirae bacterium]|nr:hypothetical protein [Nitrospirota bacterium]